MNERHAGMRVLFICCMKLFRQLAFAAMESCLAHPF